MGLDCSIFSEYVWMRKSDFLHNYPKYFRVRPIVSRKIRPIRNKLEASSWETLQLSMLVKVAYRIRIVHGPGFQRRKLTNEKVVGAR